MKPEEAEASSSGGWCRDLGVIWAGANVLGGRVCREHRFPLGWGRVWDIFPPNPSFWDGCGAAGCLLTPAEHPELVNEQNAFSYTEGILNWLHMDSGGCRTFPEGDGMSRNVGLMKEARH